MELFLKYLTWALTVAVAFAGSWFFDFTRTDPATGRKRLTTWGRRGIVVASLSLVGALALTVLSDVESAQKEAAAKEQRIKEQEAADSARAEMAIVRENTQELLRLIRNNMERFPAPVRGEIIKLTNLLTELPTKGRQPNP